MNFLKFTASDDPIVPDPGLYDNVPFDEYLRWNCFSKSMVGAAMKSGKRLEHFIKKGKNTASIRFGSLADCLILEPDTYSSTYVMRPDTYNTEVTKGRGDNKTTTIVTKPWNSNSKTCKATMQDIEMSGKVMITPGELVSANEIKAAVMGNQEASQAIREGKKQVSACWIDPDTGIPCKCRYDIIGDEFITDLKTTHDACSEEFTRTIGKYNHMVQAGAYTLSHEIITSEFRKFRFIVAETGGHTEKPDVALYDMEEDSILAGRVMWNTALQRVSQWMQCGVQGYSKFWEPIGGPGWLVNRILEEYEGEGTV